MLTSGLMYCMAIFDTMQYIRPDVSTICVGQAASMGALLLAAGMYGLGMGIRARDLWPMPLQVLTLATISTLIAAGTSLALVLALT